MTRFPERSVVESVESPRLSRRGDVEGSRTFGVYDPATESLIDEVFDADATDARAAVDSAAGAFPRWAATAPRARSEVLRRVFDLMMARSEYLTRLITSENGKSPAEARAEVAYAAEFFRWFAEETVRSEGDYFESPDGGARTIVTARPVGVAALVTPWNFPAAMATRKIAPALAAGCTVVLKPAEETPLTALAISQLVIDAGAPDGTVNVVPSTSPADVVGSWLADQRVRKLSFTGSTAVGMSLLRRAADRVLNTSMELGGNAPFIVAADADMDAAVAGALVAKFRNWGQACTAANRFFIHASVVREFTSRLCTAADRLTPTPLISERAVARVASLTEEALDEGAVVAYRGRTPDRGWFAPATVLVDVDPDMRVAREEIFGPVAPVVSWEDESELLSQVNRTDAGLAGYVYSGRLQDCIRIAEQLEVGMVGINRGAISDPSAPFGGMKQSGIGREGARAGIREYQETQYFSIDLG